MTPVAPGLEVGKTREGGRTAPTLPGMRSSLSDRVPTPSDNKIMEFREGGSSAPTLSAQLSESAGWGRDLASNCKVDFVIAGAWISTDHF